VLRSDHAPINMLSSLKKLLAIFEERGDGPGLQLGDLRLATAALMVHAAAIDGRVEAAERTSLYRLLTSHFLLGKGEAEELLESAELIERDAIDIYSFTRVIQAHLSQDKRQEIVRLMWEVVVADGKVHPYESNLVWRASELIGVSTRDRVAMRQEVFARHGICGDN